MTELRPWLWVGKYAETRDLDLLRAYRIEAMLQLAEHVPQPGIETLFLEVQDGEPLDPELLRRGTAFVRDQKSLGRRVLIACGAGISRSPTFCVAALVEEESLALLDALRVVSGAELWASLCAHYGEDVPVRRMMDEIRPWPARDHEEA
jgi:protein-tyrosine phosphatase